MHQNDAHIPFFFIKVDARQSPKSSTSRVHKIDHYDNIQDVDLTPTTKSTSSAAKPSGW
jgi:hypothetical protein